MAATSAGAGNDYLDPSMDPEVRRRVMQRLQQPTGEPTAPGTPAPSASATPSPTFTTPTGDPRAVTQKNESNPAQPPETAPAAPAVPGQPPGFRPNLPPPPGAPTIPSFAVPGSNDPHSPNFGHMYGTTMGEIIPNFMKNPNFAPTSQSLDTLLLALNNNGIQATRATHAGGLPSDDKIIINGQTYDLITNVGGPNAAWNTGWMNNAGGGGDAGSSSAVPPGYGQTTNPFLEQIRQMLMERMGRDMQPVNENDAYIAAPMSAARNEASRSSDAERKALAERLYASGGLNSNALETGIRQSGERTAIGLGSLRGQLIARELQARRQDLAEAFQGALASGDAQMARQVQEAIAQLDAMLRREGYGVSLAINTAGQNAATVGAGANG